MLCKKHNRPKDQAWTERQEHGGMLMRVGCLECKQAALNKPPRPAKREVKVKSFWRRWK
jgi:hypothetical protein